MELQYHGANCVRISTKKSVLLVDPVSDIAEIKPDLKKVNSILASRMTYLPSKTEEGVFVVDGPGEYEFEDYSILGVAAQPHTGTTGDKSATIYKVTAQDVSALFLGNIDSKLTEEQLEQIGMVDVLVVPVGGNGYTLDATSASSVVKAIEPKLVIPIHSKEDGLKYDVAQDDIDSFVKELGAPVNEEKVQKLKLKTLPEQMNVQIITKS